MFDIFEILYSVLFFSIPAAVIVFFVISLCRYISAKRKNKLAPGTVSPEEMKTRKILLIVSGAIAATLVLVAIGFILLLYMAVAFM